MIRLTLLIAALIAPLPALAQAEAAAATEAPAAEVMPPAITVSTVAPARLRDRVIASGLVVAVEQVQVQPLTEGQPIEALLVDVGDTVIEGQVLAQLSRATLDLRMSELVAQRLSVQAAIEQAEASLGEATASAEEAERVALRNETLVEQGTISRAAADQSKAAADQARARVRASEQGIASARAQSSLVEAQINTLNLQLARTEVRAPVAGQVVGRNAQVGGIASANGDPMFTLVRDGALEMAAEVSEQDLIRLAPGQAVALTGIGWASPIPGTVRLVEPTIDTQTRLGHVRVSIDDPAQVRVGMFLEAEIMVSEADLLALPVTAVSAGAEGATVMRVVDGMARSARWSPPASAMAA